MKPAWLLLVLALPWTAHAGTLALAAPLVTDNLLDVPSQPVPGDNFLMAPAIRGGWQLATTMTDVPEGEGSCKTFLDHIQTLAQTVGQGDNGADVRRAITAPSDQAPGGVDTLYVHLPQAHVEEVWVCRGGTPAQAEQTWSRFTPMPLQQGQVSLINQAIARHLPLGG